MSLSSQICRLQFYLLLPLEIKHAPVQMALNLAEMTFTTHGIYCIAA